MLCARHPVVEEDQQAYEADNAAEDAAGAQGGAPWGFMGPKKPKYLESMVVRTQEAKMDATGVHQGPVDRHLVSLKLYRAPQGTHGSIGPQCQGPMCGPRTGCTCVP